MTASTLGMIAQTASGEDLWRGLSIAIVGLLIVFTALILISLFIAALPRLLGRIAEVFPEVDEAHVRQGHPESQVPDDARVIAAIGYVLHTELQKQIAMEKKSRE